MHFVMKIPWILIFPLIWRVITWNYSSLREPWLFAPLSLSDEVMTLRSIGAKWQVAIGFIGHRLLFRIVFSWIIDGLVSWSYPLRWQKVCWQISYSHLLITKLMLSKLTYNNNNIQYLYRALSQLKALLHIHKIDQWL